ncbi:c-type cytochrome [Magnetovibrio sp.]|uniref:c-type cytochrome n=1 Tax=Magnetovibrio sp. TaxID=2024836 RepID=UPI002F9543FF
MSSRARLSVIATLTLTLTMSTMVGAQGPAPAGLDAQVKDALQMCFQCHGAGGVSTVPTRPTIAGQKSEYIRRQLVAFKTSAREAAQAPKDRDGDADNGPNAAVASHRNDPVMEHMAADLPDQLIAPLAQAMSGLACDGGAAKVARKNPLPRPPAAEACVVCHGADGIGLQSQVPNLAGQNRAYLRRQLLLIRETAWGAQPREGEAWRSHPIMEAKVARLQIPDIDAIARYFASLDCRGTKADSTN